MKRRLHPYWEYVRGWGYCRVCGCLRPTRAMMEGRGASDEVLWRCKDTAWCARWGAAATRGGAPPVEDLEDR